MTGLGSNHFLPAIDRLVKTPEFVRSYYRQLKILGDGVFSPVAMGPLLDRVFNGTGLPVAQVTAMKNFSADRTSWVLSQIPDHLSVVDSLPQSNGFPRSATATISLTGRSDAIHTVRVSIAGQSAVWSAWEASWSAAGVVLHPGLNRILITALGEEDVEVDRLVHEVWYDDGTTQPAGNAITANTVWTAANGPYLINSTVTIAAGATLTIEPGTSVFLSGGANVVIANGGRILAEGTAAAPIWFGRAPGGSVWGADPERRCWIAGNPLRPCPLRGKQHHLP